MQQFVKTHHWFPVNVPEAFDHAGAAIKQWSSSERNLLYTLRRGLGNPAFYYTLAYCTCVVVFGIARIRRRRTPYITWQTVTLMCVQCIPLFILPELILPWLGRKWVVRARSTVALAGRQPV